MMLYTCVLMQFVIGEYLFSVLSLCAMYVHVYERRYPGGSSLIYLSVKYCLCMQELTLHLLYLGCYLLTV